MPAAALRYQRAEQEQDVAHAATMSAGVTREAQLESPNLLRSFLRTQPGQRDIDKPSDRSLRQKTPCGTEGVQAVICQLLRRHVVPEPADRSHLDEQVPDQV